MNGFIKILYYFVQFTWCLPQSILGFIFFLKQKGCRRENFFGSILTYHNGNWGGVSLGAFTFVNGRRPEEWVYDTKIHEYGHTIQSLILGPLYLFVIGIPSSVWCNSKKYIKLRQEKNLSYYTFYPESWANKLGQKVTKLTMHRDK